MKAGTDPKLFRLGRQQYFDNGVPACVRDEVYSIGTVEKDEESALAAPESFRGGLWADPVYAIAKKEDEDDND
jgi:hypothetical protein